MLHGCTQDADDISRGTRFNEVAGGKGFLVAYPEQAQKFNGLKCWNWFDAAHQSRDKGEPALIALIAQRVMHDYSVDAKRVYVAGVSAGAAMALTTAYAYPELFVAAGIHSGIAYAAVTSIANALMAMHSGAPDQGSLGSAVVKAFGSARHFPAIVFQGKADKSVNWVNSSQIVWQLLQSYAPENLTKLADTPGEAGGYHFTKTTYGVRIRSSKSGSWMSLVTHGREARRTVRTPMPMAPMRAARWFDSFSSIREAEVSSGWPVFPSVQRSTATVASPRRGPARACGPCSR